MADWIILQLSDSIENPEYRDIHGALVKAFGDHAEFFIPIHHEKVGSYTSTCTLFQGYVFVKDGHEVREALSTVTDNRLFQGPLRKADGKIHTERSTVVASLRRRLTNSLKSKIPIGSLVKISEGPLKDLVGQVVGIEDGGHVVVVKVRRYSRDILAPIPATLVEKVESEDA